MEYVYADVNPGPYACRLGSLENVEDTYELVEGIFRKENWPENALFRMDENFEQDIKTEDFISNTAGVLVVSQRVKDVLSDLDLNYNEWLNVKILNHRNRKINKLYYIFHQIDLQDCIDFNSSIFEKNPIDPSIFISLDKLVIDDKRIKRNVFVFRMMHFPFICVFHRSVAQRIIDAGCSGVIFRQLDEWED